MGSTAFDVSGSGNNYEIYISDIYKPDNDALGLVLEGTIDTENDKEADTYHYIRTLLSDRVIDIEGTLKSGDERLEINNQVLYGKNHMYVIAILKFFKHQIKLVCARRKIQQFNEINGKINRKSTCLTSFDKSTKVVHKAKSMETLHLTDNTLSRTTRTHSLEAFSNLALWSNSTLTIELNKDPSNPSNSPVIVIRALATIDDITLGNMNSDYSINILKSISNGPDKLTASKLLQYQKVINDKYNDDEVLADSCQDVNNNNNNNQRLSRIGKRETTAQIMNNHKNPTFQLFIQMEELRQQMLQGFSSLDYYLSEMKKLINAGNIH
ncbi:unnamed protein product [Rotaria magnacalcarata]|uniref:PDZ domain-containing protein n=2 Tax=Rotaria magnacalcarata TaxID=392030 RepID=A0A818X613_9BILA|nr:unnamed protein product [Rotaria magnacalcarata]